MLSKNVLCAFVGISALTLSPESLAQFDFVLGAGYDFGGDTISTAYYTNGDSTKVKSGSGLLAFAGADFYLQNDFKVRGTIGYKSSSASATNGEISFSRIPVDLLILKHYGQHQFGVGATYHTGVEFECEVHGTNLPCNDSYDFKNSLGFIAHYEHLMPAGNNNAYVFGLRYTKIEYEGKGFDFSYDGSSFGVNIGYIF
ncbi:hypothetical protein [Photobacterium galatheae]|uniref:Outer membrane protein beta-barrel domain-containing protein n=1 Tax=Photobacterium galatheae TaxID=1654360 RepID=A0A066RVT1_9GAMM|nr:hypothetical protein [Photobacterium galatheae]KDM91498.1 hypothetical protein EA58_10760 [Photobacterium galatheae]MCM0149571.1 hypothetical protein [Photobacterium galatheae]